MSGTGGETEPRPVQMEAVAPGWTVRPGDLPPAEHAQPRAWTGPPATGTVALTANDGDADIQVVVGAHLEVFVKKGDITVTAAPLVLVPTDGWREGEDSRARFDAIRPGRATLTGTLRLGGPKAPSRHWYFEVTVHEEEPGRP